MLSIEVIKSGLFDTLQDQGRYGYQHLGINPGGAMDQWAMRIANLLVGNHHNEVVIEMTFPAARLRFNAPALIALAGADFNPVLNGKTLALWQPVAVAAGSVLEFTRCKNGMFCYLAVHKGLRLSPWLGSMSTHIAARQGGLHGRCLKAGDQLPLNSQARQTTETQALSFRAATTDFYLKGPVGCLPGPEPEETSEAADRFTQQKFYIHPQSNRMGYRLVSTLPLPAPQADKPSEAVTFGTLQLLPSGELMALMADHQTTGGYPRLAVMGRAWQSAFVQRRPGDTVEFKWITAEEAHVTFAGQLNAFRRLKTSCYQNLKTWLHENY